MNKAASEKKQYGVLDLLWDIRSLRFVKGSDFSKLNYRAKHVLMMIASRSDIKKDFSCYPSQIEIAEDCAMSVDSVGRALKELEDKSVRLITRKKRFDNSDLIYINVPLIRKTVMEQKINKTRDESSPFSESAELLYESIAHVAARLAEEAKQYRLRSSGTEQLHRLNTAADDDFVHDDDSSDDELPSEPVELANRYLIRLGNSPAHRSAAKTKWPVIFDRLLREYSEPDLRSIIDCAFEDGSFWQERMFRRDGSDPVEYFEGKLPQIYAHWRSELAEKQFAIKSSTRTKSGAAGYAPKTPTLSPEILAQKAFLGL